MVKTKRNYGIDLIKIIACILVITLHSLDPTKAIVMNNTFNLSLYYVGTLAIPIFFMASGYFIINRNSISYNFSLNRVINVLFVVLCWLFIYSFLKFIFKHDFNFINELAGSAFTGIPDSNFYHFWFFWSYMIILLIAPIIVWVLKKGFKYFLLLIAIITIICWLQDISLHIGYAYLMRNTPQVFRLNIWLEYFLLGGLVGNAHFDPIKKYFKKHFLTFCLLDLILYIILVAYSLWNRNVIGWAYAEANYNNILVMLVAVISMTLFAVAEPKGEQAIEFVIKATMGIYILQTFAIDKLSKIGFFTTYPVTLIPVVFLLCLIAVEIGLQIPGVKRLFKL